MSKKSKPFSANLVAQRVIDVLLEALRPLSAAQAIEVMDIVLAIAEEDYEERVEAARR